MLKGDAIGLLDSEFFSYRQMEGCRRRRAEANGSYISNGLAMTGWKYIGEARDEKHSEFFDMN